MARKSRIHFPEALYHVIVRGNARQDIFFGDADRCRFLLLLQEEVERFGYRVHAFCLMQNHAHLALQVGNVPLSRGMQNLCFRYAMWVNRCQNRSGHLFQGRYKALLVHADTYHLALVRYIHLNPYRCGVVTDPTEYRWSSHRVYCGLETLPWLSTDMTLAAFGSSVGQARRKYGQFIRDGLDEGHRAEFHGTSGSDSRVLGDELFVGAIVARAKQLKGAVVTVNALLSAVCVVYDLPLDEISSGRRLASEARSMSAWITLETTGCTLAQLAAATGRAPSSLSSAAKRIEARARKESRMRDQRDKILQLIAQLHA